MTRPPSIDIRINTSELDEFCKKLLKRSRDIAKTHDAIVTLETFISLFSRASHGSNEYRAIEDTIKAISEISRQQLLEKNTHDLIAALKQCNIMTLTAVHSPLSRNGFYQILQAAIEAISDDDIRLIMIWSANWVMEAKQLAEEASACPDEMNFKKSGISLHEYQAMCDVDRVLNTPH